MQIIKEGLYEQIINKLVATRLNELDKNHFYIKNTLLDKQEAAKILTQYLANVIRGALSIFSGEQSIEKQIELSNKIIFLLRDELNNSDFDEDIIDTEGKILSAIFSKIDARFADFDKHLKEITPYTRLSHSELFTGSNAGVSLESELKKEIL